MIVIDPGHGGNDPGAIGSGIVEKDYTLMISKYQYDRFRQLGVPVSLTRSTDETVSPETRVQRVLSAFGNRADVIVLSNHLNASGGDGAEVIYALRNRDTLSRLIAEEIAKEGQNIRKWYQRRLPSDTSKDYYFIHRNTGITEPVLIEYGFVDSPGNDPQLIKNNWRDLAEAVVRAVSSYKGIPYDLAIDEGVYIVKSGDTLYSIARRFNVSVDAIRRANNLTTDTLRIGQRLIIPDAVPPSLVEVTYVVQRGDTLYSIARAYNTTVNEIMRANNLTTTTLRVGQTLKIPTPSPPVTEPITPPPPPSTYTVKSGDSLYSIARQFGTTVQALRDLNNLTTDTLRIGQILRIPTTLTPAPTTITYTVKSGDSLYSIAQRYGTTVTAIRNLNSLTTTTLRIGQVLQIPITGTTPTTPITYTVKSGDSLYSIAQRYGTTVTAIRNLNNLTTTTLRIGQILLIPANTERQEESLMRQEELLPEESSELIRYTVKSGDSLFSIANRFNTSVPFLRRINNLTTDILRIGQELLVPRNIIEGELPISPNLTTYVVRKGDTLWSIARRFGTSISVLRVLNNIETDIIRVDQEMLVPITQPLQVLPGTTTYIIKKGDTLWDIARRYNTTVDDLKTLNNLTTDLLNVGKILLVPLETSVDDRQVELEQPLPVIIRYTIKRGDTLSTIAQRFGTNVETLRRINNLTTDILRVGQELLVPRSPVDIALPITAPTIAIYTVERGNTLWSIARQFGTTVSALKELNELTTNLINVGQELLVPITPPLTIPPGTTTYIVKRGDTLYSISQKYETDVETIKTLNELTTDTINIGQILLIPLA